ncbi:hypothetical protein [Frankia sp. R82]|uniref:hypothetical protein n=1 Tax=Frankia sp. R82 TaxID=2950553 RepID=UPI002043E2A2|nr:hypothetical protein [Frankia sp. R82]MCM3885196.1 hypothetical protein [Frankia sp. R82]
MTWTEKENSQSWMERRWFGRTNRISGYFIVLFSSIVYLFLTAFPDSGGSPGMLLPFLAAFPFSVPSWLFFVRPELATGGCDVIIRNPVTETRIPWSEVTCFDGNGKYLVVETADRDYKVMGLEQANISRLRKEARNQVIAVELEEIRRDRIARCPGGRVVTRVKPPERTAVAFFFLIGLLGVILHYLP